MEFEQLKEKALSLPLSPGVYIMRNQKDTVIYVGKAKKLKNRVSQYFQDTASHSPKTRRMVSHIHHFEVIVAASEFEALILECSLIKKYMPKYNILLKDDKGYPYIRLNRKAEYPTIELSNKVMNDGAEYYGPFGSRGVTNSIIQSLRSVLKLPSCSKKFPKDIGKERPCLHYHMDQCAGWCRNNSSHQAYLERIELVRQMLSGNYKKVTDDLKNNMISAAEKFDFEQAASLRDQLRSLEALGKKQLVTAAAQADSDVVGYAQTEGKACFAVLHYSGGALLDKDYEIISIPEDPAQAVGCLVKQYYIGRGFAPRRILLPFEVEDSELFCELLQKEYGQKTKILVPQRGDNANLVSLANKNAYEEAARITTKEEKCRGVIALLGKMLSIPLPKRIEAYDVSNISGADIVAGMIVFEDGRPVKNEYKKFRINGLDGQDDYASMYQVLHRRFTSYREKQKGFESFPDLLLIDGGERHAAVAEDVLSSLSLSVPAVGMVKDDHHRTRALVTADGKIIRIDANQSVFSFIGTIQEETHRFAVSYHRKLRSKRLRHSGLDGISGIGPKRKQELLRRFRSISAIAAASVVELEQYLPGSTARAVYEYFRKEETEV